jgi:hypothetical protein
MISSLTWPAWCSAPLHTHNNGAKQPWAETRSQSKSFFLTGLSQRFVIVTKKLTNIEIIVKEIMTENFPNLMKKHEYKHPGRRSQLTARKMNSADLQ